MRATPTPTIFLHGSKNKPTVIRITLKRIIKLERFQEYLLRAGFSPTLIAAADN
jgi:hypothetical protein